jgi:hypothetical protein
MKNSEELTTSAPVGMETTVNNTVPNAQIINTTSINSTTIRETTTTSKVAAVAATNPVTMHKMTAAEDSVSAGAVKKANESVVVKVAETKVDNVVSKTNAVVEKKNDDGNDRVTIDKKPNKPLVPRSIKTDDKKISSVASLNSTTITTDKNKILTTATAAEIHRLESPQITGIKISPPPQKQPPVHTVAPHPNHQVVVVTGTIPPIVVPLSLSTTEINTAKKIIANVPKNNNDSTATKTDIIDESTTPSIPNEEYQRKRAPLTEKYSPYVTYTDTCLGDARSRLQIALDQTRQLRAAFTERVYGKYRICLQPPSQTNDIIKTIIDHPNGMYRKIQKEIKLIKEVKNIEKREVSQKSDSDVPTATATALPSSSSSADAPASSKDNSVGGSSSASASDATTAVEDPNNNNNIITAASNNYVDNAAEQKMYVTSGLSLVVLPEDDVSSIDLSMYQDRGPTYPKTGQKVRGISAAAATSGKTVLERARQGKVAKIEREKRSQQKVVEQAHNFFDSKNYSKPPQTIKRSGTSVAAPLIRPPPSVTTATTVTTLKPPPGNAAVAVAAKSTIKTNPSLISSSVLGQKPKTKVASPRSRGSSKTADGKKGGGVKRVGAQKSSTPASAKAIRAKVQATMSLNTLLNLNPIHEELRTDTKYSAATLAMMERGVGTFQGPTTQYHKNTPHRFKHPFPDSLGGRRRPVGSSSSAPKQNVATSSSSQGDASQSTQLQLVLPPIPSVKDRRRHKKITVLPKEKAATTRATLSIRKILDQFTSSAIKGASRVAVESNATPENTGTLLGRPKKQRRVSEIGFIRGLYLDSQDEEKARIGLKMTGTIQDPDSRKHGDVGIDSSLTLNVLKAVGLIKSSISGDKNSERSCFQTSLASSLFNENSTTETGESFYSDSVSKLKDLEHRLSTQKRSYTEAFYGDTERLDTKNVDLNSDNITESQIDQETKIEPRTSAPLSLRGGGSKDVLLDSNNDGKKSAHSQEQKTDGSGLGLGTAAQNSQAAQAANRNGSRQQIHQQNQTMNAAAATQANIMHQNMLWNERSQQQQRLASMQGSPLLANSGGMVQQHAAGQLQAQYQSAQSADHYRHTNALQLAHQLRLSRLSANGHATAADMADYIGGLRHSQAQAQAHAQAQAQAQAAYDWSSSVGATSAAAAVASSQSLAALGLNPNNRAGIMNLSVEDQRRVLLAREQQNMAVRVAAAQRQQAVALMRGMAAVDNTPYAQPGYPHIPGQLLNTPAPGLMGRPGIQNQSRSIIINNNNNATPSKKPTTEHNATSQKLKLKRESPQQHAKSPQKAISVDRSLPKEQPAKQKVNKIEQKQHEKKGHKIEIKENKNGIKPKATESKTIIDKKKDDATSGISVSNKRKVSPNIHKEAIPSEKKSRTFIAAKSKGPSAVVDVSVANLPPKPSNSTDKSKQLPKLENKPSVVKKESRGRTDSEGSSTKKFMSKPIQKTPSSISKDVISMDIERNVQKNATVKVAPTGLQYYVPPAPTGISSDFATTVLAGRCHEAIGVSVYRDLAVEGLRVVNYITAVGMAVPIPKTVITNPLKERMNGLVFKNSNVGSMPASSRDIIAAVILLWLWRNQESSFQRAFAKSGRIDVDPECKWFVNTAVNKAVSALSNEVLGSTSRASGLTTALLAHKSKSSIGPKGTHGIAEQDSIRTTTTKIDLLVASVVSKSLNMTLVLNEEMNSAIPQFDNLVDYLDECRKSALFAKSQERALLAAIVSRKATMSFSFSHAYVSAMVRAGEALGHGPLFEVVQDESCGVSTMIPYDVFTDESGGWEDPCRPLLGFTEGLTGDELMRRGHTRAMIQKSLKKLQDRQNVKGGAQIAGPYIDTGSSSASSTGSKASSAARGGSHRRRSSASEPSIQTGSGSAIATSWALYEPNHQSPPLEWNANAIHNSAYGRHNMGTRPRSLSLAQGAAVLRHSGKVPRRRRSSSSIPVPVVSAVQQKEQVVVLDKSSNEEVNVKPKPRDVGSRISTREIPWGDIAGIFQKVQLPDAIKEQKEKEAKLSAKERTIFAPVVRKLDSIPVIDDEEEESDDEEEDLTDETILARHRVVLDRMKARLTFVLENNKKRNQDRRKSRDKSSK